LAPTESGGGQLIGGPLEHAFIRDFGSFDEFKKIFNASAAGIQGSGWGWVVRFFVCFLTKSQKTHIYICGWVGGFRDITNFRGNSKL
jgi:superoxide dismutase